MISNNVVYATSKGSDQPAHKRRDVAHSIGVQNAVLPFFCLQEPIHDVLVIFYALKLGVYVRPVKSLLILSFYLSKQLMESSRTQNLGVKRL